MMRSVLKMVDSFMKLYKRPGKHLLLTGVSTQLDLRFHYIYTSSKDDNITSGPLSTATGFPSVVSLTDCL